MTYLLYVAQEKYCWVVRVSAAPLRCQERFWRERVARHPRQCGVSSTGAVAECMPRASSTNLNRALRSSLPNHRAAAAATEPHNCDTHAGNVFHDASPSVQYPTCSRPKTVGRARIIRDRVPTTSCHVRLAGRHLLALWQHAASVTPAPLGRNFARVQFCTRDVSDLRKE